MSARAEVVAPAPAPLGQARRFSVDRFVEWAVTAYEQGTVDGLGLVAHIDWIANEARADWPDVSVAVRASRLLSRVCDGLVDEDATRLRQQRFVYLTHRGNAPGGDGDARRFALANDGVSVVVETHGGVPVYHPSRSYDPVTGAMEADWPALGEVGEVGDWLDAWAALARQVDARRD